MDEPTSDALEVADYRRQIAAVYVDVRRALDEHGSEPAWNIWQTGRHRLFADHPQSPWSGRPKGDRGPIPTFDHDPAWSLDVGIEPPETDDPIGLPHSGDGITMAAPIGTVAVPGGRLTLYWLEQYGGGLFLPFRDATCGDTTYGGGRYLLDGAKSADLGGVGGRLRLDFNFAYHPSCFHDPRWSCPLAPPANTLGVAVRAGERADSAEAASG